LDRLFEQEAKNVQENQQLLARNQFELQLTNRVLKEQAFKEAI
jgi:hypothetical protein